MPAEMESRIKMNFDRAAAEATSKAADIARRTITISGLYPLVVSILFHIIS